MPEKLYLLVPLDIQELLLGDLDLSFLKDYPGLGFAGADLLPFPSSLDVVVNIPFLPFLKSPILVLLIRYYVIILTS